MAGNVNKSGLLAVKALFEKHGGCTYGEGVTQIEHALQCAVAAQADGAMPCQVTAALLHDVGHMLHEDARQALLDRVDDRHEALGASWLKQWFVDEVSMPVALHVEAKRYLCHVDPGYHSGLSSVSQTTLAMQGGPMTAEQAQAFRLRPFADEAVAVRRWDEIGKDPAAVTPSLDYFLEIAARGLRTAP